MTKETKNPLEYVYKPGTKIEIEGGFLLEILGLTDQLLQDEIKRESKFKYNFINTETQKIIKSPKEDDLKSGKVKKTVDWSKTIDNPTFEFSLTEKGVTIAQLKKFLENIHMTSIDNGLAVHYSNITDNKTD